MKFSDIINLNEVNVQPKKLYGDIVGSTHSIFSSKKNPDRLYKVGKKEIIEIWVNVFKQYPTLFPKVYRVGKISGLEEGDERFFVEIEKLNTSRVIDEWMVIQNALIEIGYLTKYDEVDSFLYTHISNELKEKLINYNRDIFELMMKWVNFIDDVHNALNQSDIPYFDVHRYNFGYDSSGNMKCLDI